MMSSYLFDIVTNCEILQGESIHKSFIVNCDEESKSEDLEEVIDISNCISLTAKDKDSEFCRLKITSDRPIKAIKQVEILCDVKKIEVFGNHMEYLKTYFGRKIEEIDGSSVFKFIFEFHTPQSQCSCKLISTKDNIWIYGGRIKACEMMGKDSNQSHMDMLKIKERLHVGDKELTKNASNFLKLMDNFRSSDKTSASSLVSSANFTKLMPFLQSANFDKPDEIKLKCENEEFSISELADKFKSNTILETNNSDFCDIKDFMKLEMTRIETNMAKRISEVENRINNKLDLILKHLNITE